MKKKPLSFKIVLHIHRKEEKIPSQFMLMVIVHQTKPTKSSTVLFSSEIPSHWVRVLSSFFWMIDEIVER